MNVKKIQEWFRAHGLIRALLRLLILAVIAWLLGQLAGPALMKLLFL